MGQSPGRPSEDRHALLRHALDQPDRFTALYQAVRQMRGEGVAKSQLLADLEGLRGGLDEAIEDEVLEVMDFLVGYCSPGMEID